MTNVSSEIKDRDGYFLSRGRETRGTYARCLIKIAIIWAFRVVVMRPMDRLSAAVHVPDNRAASIIPHSYHFFPTSSPSSLSNKDENLRWRAVLRPRPARRKKSERVESVVWRIIHVGFLRMQIWTRPTQTSSTLVQTSLRVIGDVRSR